MRGLREGVLAVTAAALAVWMWLGVQAAPERGGVPLHRDVASRLLSAPECHCGRHHGPYSGRIAYRGLGEEALIPAGFSPDLFRLYQQRHGQAYVDWWNIDEGNLRLAAREGDAAILRGMGRMRRSAQSVLLGEAHQQLALGLPEERAAASPVRDRLAALAGSEAALGDRLLAAWPDPEGWVVLGVDLRTGEPVLANPDAEASTGLWGGYPVLTVDAHHTAHYVQFGEDHESYFRLLWGQINCAALERRAGEAQRLIGRPIPWEATGLTPLTPAGIGTLNDAALEAVSLRRAEGPPPDVPAALATGLRELLGEAWRGILERVVATAPQRAVLGLVLETGQLELFHTARPEEGVWGVVPLASFLPDQADHLASLDWREAETRRARWAGRRVN